MNIGQIRDEIIGALEFAIDELNICNDMSMPRFAYQKERAEILTAIAEGIRQNKIVINYNNGILVMFGGEPVPDTFERIETKDPRLIIARGKSKRDGKIYSYPFWRNRQMMKGLPVEKENDLIELCICLANLRDKGGDVDVD